MTSCSRDWPAGQARDGPVPTWFEDWLQAEGEAQSLRIWSPMLIPGLCRPPNTLGPCS